MYNELKNKRRLYKKRALRVRNKLRGTASRPRLTIFKSNSHLFVQLIDDDQGKTLASASTYDKAKRGTPAGRKNKEAAAQIGREIAQKAVELQLKQVVFDRGPYKYHGILAAMADSARESGLEF